MLSEKFCPPGVGRIRFGFLSMLPRAVDVPLIEIPILWEGYVCRFSVGHYQCSMNMNRRTYTFQNNQILQLPKRRFGTHFYEDAKVYLFEHIWILVHDVGSIQIFDNANRTVELFATFDRNYWGFRSLFHGKKFFVHCNPNILQLLAIAFIAIDNATTWAG